MERLPAHSSPGGTAKVEEGFILMNLVEQLHQGNTRANRDFLAHWAGTDKRRFGELMIVYLTGDFREAQLAAGVLFSCFQFHPELINPWLQQVVRRMDTEGVHSAVRRFGVWVLQTADIPRTLQGRVADMCFRYIADPSETIAIRAFALNVLARIAKVEPDLSHELQQTIEAAVLPAATPALLVRSRRVLRQLSKGRKKTESKILPLSEETPRKE